MAEKERPKMGDAVIKWYEQGDLSPERIQELRKLQDQLTEGVKPGDRAAYQRIVRKLTSEARASRFEQFTGRPAKRRRSRQ